MTTSSLTKNLFEKFELFADAPGAVTKMRGMIRTLAVSGRLLRECKASDWHIVKMKDVCDQITDGEHSTPQRISSGVPLATAKNVRDGFLDLTNTDYVAHSTAEKCWKRCKPQHQDILMVCVGATTGRVCLAQNPPDMVLVRSVALIRPKAEIIEPSYLDLFLRSSLGQEQIWGNVKQSAQPCLYLGKMADFEIPLPPLAEQKRIVAKVDELMALCDRLEAQQQERETRHATLARASLARFADAPTPANLQFLFHSAYAIDPANLRKSILTLAVQGKLVPQDPNDEPAEEWLQTVLNPKHTQPFELTDAPFAIPYGWTWLRVESVFEVAGGIQKTPHRTPRDNAFPYLGVGNVYRGRLDLTNVKKFELEAGEIERRRLEAGDLLIIEGNGSFNEIGRCAKWNGEIENCVHQNHVIRCRPFDERISDFVLLFLNSPNGMEIMQRLAITSSGLYSLSVGKIRQIEIPLPPLAEQRRIVAKVEQLMTLVDELETQLTASRATASRLLEAIVAELTAQE